MSSYREVLAGVLLSMMVVSLGIAQDWTLTSAPGFGCLASSADGRKLVGGYYWGGPPIYISTNFGSTWTSSNSPTNHDWWAIACSADGSVIIAAGYGPPDGGGLYVSPDSGATWRLAFSLGVYYWNSVACSSDGKRMVAVSNSGYNTDSVYSSTNSGADCVQLAGSPRAGPITTSADGSRLAIATGATVDVSTNFGLSWTSRYPTSEPANHRLVTTSGEGGTLMVLSAPTNSSLPAVISISSDWGATWRPVGSTTNTSWYTVSGACSAEGVTLAIADSPLAADDVTRLLLSTNSGASWSTQLIGGTNICSVVSSVDGSRLAAALGPTGFYVRQATPVPRLKIISDPGGFQLSWLLPSEPFALEESPDLLTWSRVGATPMLNYTNLHYVANLPTPLGPKFYRLISQ